MGKFRPSVSEVQGHLRHMHQTMDLTAEQRYSLMAAIETIEFLKMLSPGLRRAVEEGHKLVAAKAR